MIEFTLRLAVGICEETLNIIANNAQIHNPHSLCPGLVEVLYMHISLNPYDNPKEKKHDQIIGNINMLYDLGLQR